MTTALSWKLRRAAADIRQQDIALRAGISTTRYSAIEREEQEPTELEIQLIEQFLPQLPVVLSGPARTEARTGALRCAWGPVMAAQNENGLPLAFNTPRQIRPEALAKIKSELVRLGTNGSRTGFEFARRMFEHYPELRSL